MSTLTAQQAYDEIVAYMRKQGDFRSWYAGVSADAKQRLFTDHRVTQNGGWWIWRPCQTDGAARQVEEALLKAGCDGGSGGGDRTATHVYAYFKTTQTLP